MNNFERIKKAVEASTISVDDKTVISDLFAQVSDENLLDIADLFEKKSSWVSIFNDNRKKKIEAYSNGNQDAWNEILEQEKKYLEELTYGLD